MDGENDLIVAQWLGELKELLLDIGKRSRLAGDLCPFLYGSDDDRPSKLKALAVVHQSISDRCQKMREIESQNDEISVGVSALLDREGFHSTPLYIAVCCLFGARLHPQFHHECRTTGEVMALSACGCAVSSLIIRNAFRDVNPTGEQGNSEGILLSWVRISAEPNIDQCTVELTDHAIAIMTNKKPTDREVALAVLGSSDIPPQAQRRR